MSSPRSITIPSCVCGSTVPGLHGQGCPRQGIRGGTTAVHYETRAPHIRHAIDRLCTRAARDAERELDRQLAAEPRYCSDAEARRVRNEAEGWQAWQCERMSDAAVLAELGTDAAFRMLLQHAAPATYQTGPRRGQQVAQRARGNEARS